MMDYGVYSRFLHALSGVHAPMQLYSSCYCCLEVA